MRLERRIVDARENEHQRTQRWSIRGLRWSFRDERRSFIGYGESSTKNQRAALVDERKKHN